ncbi:hypothetical protein G9A89_021516 [Geosiphon pyriformis]|nr:hypothetical protein G9A89_021516 [Geosiphon pyriformis]
MAVAKSAEHEFTAKQHYQHLRKETKNLCNNKFKVATTPDTATLEYYQSIYTHCKQRFNIPDGIKVVKKSVYQYIENCINNYFFGNYNISEVRSNLYNNLVHYSQLGTENLNIQFKYSFDFESETETSNKGKQRLKQYSRTTPNTPTLQKTTAKYLQTPEQGTSVKLPLSITPFPISLVQPQTPSLPLSRFSRLEDFQSPRNPTQQQKPISTSANIIDYLQENESNHSESLESKETESEPEEITENEEKMATAYIAKIPEFTGKDNDTSPQEWLDKVQKAGDANGWIAVRMLKAIPYFLQGTAEKWFENLEEPFENWQAFKNAFLQQFTDNNTSITLRNCFYNIKQETSEFVMTYLERFNKLLRRIQQLKTNNYYSDAQILDQFIAGLKDKLIKKVCPHALADLATAIRHAKSYEIAMEEANHTKLVNLAIRKTSSAVEEKIDQLTKKVESYFTNQQQQQQQPQRYQPPQQCNQNNFGLPSNNQFQNCYYCGIPGHWKRDCRKLQRDQQNRSNQCYSSLQQSYYQFPPPTYYSPRPQNQNYYSPIPQSMQRLIQHNQFTPQNQLQNNHNRINLNNQLVPRNLGQQRPNHYHTQFNEVAVLRSNPSNHTIPPAQIAQNANLLDIFLFEFEANESPFLLSNAAVNKQKTITAMYTEATVEGKPIYLILDSGSAGNRPAQTVIVTADGMKKTPVGEIDDFPFSIDGITIPVKVLVMDASQYQALVGNNWLLKANANLNWKTQELKILY